MPEERIPDVVIENGQGGRAIVSSIDIRPIIDAAIDFPRPDYAVEGIVPGLSPVRGGLIAPPVEATPVADALDEDPVSHPSHYTSHPSGVECITITEHFGFNVGNAIKYLWRAGLKSPDAKQDLDKALWYVQREIDRQASA